VQGVISALQVTYYPLGAQVMTLVLPLGFFIVVMAALYFVFARPHTVPGRRPIRGARPVAPADPGHAASLAAATGLPTATAAGGAEPLAERGTPPSVGVRTEEAIKRAAERAAAEGGPESMAEAGPQGTAEAPAEARAADDKVTGESGKDQDAAAEGSEDQE
jgi:hypothetical protein